MTSLYNCKTANGGYRITKFDKDLNVTSSYITTLENCECPQAHHKTCRHRKMLPIFFANGHVDDGWLLDFDTEWWVEPPTCAHDDGADIDPARLAEKHNVIASIGEPIEEGGPRPVSASPSTQPSHYRRMR